MNAKNERSGFTLIELSIVLIILSLLMTGVFSALAQKTRTEKQAELNRRFDVIENAIKAYYKRSSNNALPCPTLSLTTSFTSDTFGVSDSTNLCAGIVSNSFKDGNTYAGGVPTKTLGIPDEYAIDPWGNRFVYAVTAKFTAVSGNADTRGLYVYPINSSATDALTKITINDETSSAITTKAILVILSHGPDGFGSYTRNGDRNAAYSANANQQTNCHCDNSGPTLMTSTFVMRPEFSDGSTSDNNFDDKMRFYGRDSFPLPWELPTEKN